MALPELIEIVPLDKPVRAEITVPGSKSITNRALILAALADGEVTLKGALWSEDTEIMVECLNELGYFINVESDSNETCNRIIKVSGTGAIGLGGTFEKPLELFVGNAGTAARFLSAFLCLGNGVFRMSGVPRMHERPQAALFKALRELGYRVDSPNDKLPARIYGDPKKLERFCTVSIEESSQFASALMLCAKHGGWEVYIEGENPEESPYVAMTSKMIEVFRNQVGKFHVEPDASSASYIWAVKWLLGLALSDENFKIVGWENMTTLQVDSDFPTILEQMTATRARRNRVSRKLELGDSIMTAITLSPLFSEKTQFTELGNLRRQECERVVALRTELTKCGAKVVEEGDTLTVWPSPLHGAEIETYNDHRMAMCFAILGLKVPGIKIKNPACVKKTFPNFFQKLAAAPQHGLGATILDAKSGRKLTHEELFAE